jgi:NAD(P)-dependent dehydrogenase (short-subunit alcohol dehydrogenase family)
VLTKAAIPIMKAQGAGWVINLGSAEAQAPTRPYHSHATDGGATIYGAIKAALHRYTQGLAAELLADNIAVNVVAPSSAISTPGADRFIPEGFPTERVEYLAETVLACSHLPAAERTGLITHSMHFPHHHKMPVYSLDGRELLPPAEIPPWVHPLINGSGEYP